MNPVRASLISLLKRFPRLFDWALPSYLAFRPRFSVGVTAVVFNARGEVLLVEHAFRPRIPWGLPGGGLNRGEEPAQGLRRELLEELGLPVEVLAPLWIERTWRQYIDLAFYCRALGEPSGLSSELTGMDWFGRDQLPALTDFQLRAVHRGFASLQSSDGKGSDQRFSHLDCAV